MTDKAKKTPLIEVRKIKKFFSLKRDHIFQREPLQVRAVDDVSLTIYKGETFGLVGESGCGKSTLGRIILQLYPPTSGSALYYGMPLREVNPSYIIKDIKRLPSIQKRASKFYKKSEVIDAKIEKVEAFIASDEHKEIKKAQQVRVQERQKLINEQKELRKSLVKETLNSLHEEANAFRHANPDLIDIGKGIKWTDEVERIERLLNEYDGTVAIQNYITLLHIPHASILASYKKVQAVNKNINKLEQEMKKCYNSKAEIRLAKLKHNSLEHKKEASRTLKAGSEIAGEYILEAEIKTISKLMLEEELLHRKNFAAQKEKEALELRIDLNNKRLAKFVEELAILAEDKEKAKVSKEIEKTKVLIEQQEAKIVELEKVMKDCEKGQEEALKELKKYHFANPQPITERCLWPEYQKKMESNRQYAINLEKFKKEEMRRLRQKLQIIFQDPYSSLDPRMTVGQAISEAVVEHKLFKKKSPELEEYIVETMAKCGLDHYMIHRYPHQFSGGQRQRIVIARALALQPEFVVCDESVSALDVSIQSQILNLLADLKDKNDLTYLFISHDLSVIKHISDRIAVMYLGDIVELCDAEVLFESPLHPYSKALISAIPTTTQKKRDRIILEGDIPSNIFPPSGCKFRTRCPIAREKCAIDVPEFREVEPGHFVACHFYEETQYIK